MTLSVKELEEQGSSWDWRDWVENSRVRQTAKQIVLQWFALGVNFRGP